MNRSEMGKLEWLVEYFRRRAKYCEKEAASHFNSDKPLAQSERKGNASAYEDCASILEANLAKLRDNVTP